MTTQFTKLFSALSLALSSTAAGAYATTPDHQKASYIEMMAADGQTQNLAEFLAGAAPIVAQTEPGTQLWFALMAADNGLAIFDIFDNEAARNAHFEGAVASALHDQADTLVDGGWDRGVVANINNSTVLSSTAPMDLYSATTATYIKLQAAPGQGDALAKLLTAAGPIVAESEPNTLYWVAMRLNESEFAIYDVFADETGRTDHFAGQVAGLLKAKSPELVAGGWDAGVVANVTNYNILAIK